MPKYYAEYMDELERQRRLQEEQRIREESDRKLAQVAALEERARNAQLQREWANHQAKYNQMANSSAAQAAGNMVANAPSPIEQSVMQTAFPYVQKQKPSTEEIFAQASQINPNQKSAEPEPVVQINPYTSALDQYMLMRNLFKKDDKQKEQTTPRQSTLQGTNVPDGGIQQPNYALKNVPKQSTLTNVSVPDNGNRSADLVRNLENAERAEDKRAVLGDYLDSLPDNARKYLQQYEEGYLMSTSGGHGSTGSMRRAQAQGGQMMHQARENLKKELSLTDDQVTDLLQYQQYRSNYDQNEKQQAEIYNALHTGNKAKQALAAATMTAQSIMQSPVAGISAVAANTSRKAPGLGTDTYSPYFGSSNYAANVQQGVQNRIAESGTPAGQLGAKAYGIGYSIGESAYNMAGSAALGLPGLGTAGKVASLLPMGVNAYASQLREGLERGLTEEQAQTTAVISGMAEVATELLSLDHFWDIAKGSSKTARKAVIDWIAQAGIEGTEELSSDVINHVADMLLNGDKAEYRVKVQDNIDAGMTEDQAKAKATKDTLLGWVESFIGGTISGGTMGGIATAINSYNTGKQAAEMFGEDTNFREYEESIDTDEANYQNKSAAESAKEAKQLAGVLANKQENGEQISKKDIKKLYTSMMDAVQTETTTQQENARKQEEKAQLPKEDTTTETTAPTTEQAAPTTKQEAPTTAPVEEKVIDNEQESVTNEQKNPENEQKVTENEQKVTENEQNDVTSDVPEKYRSQPISQTDMMQKMRDAKTPTELASIYQQSIETGDQEQQRYAEYYRNTFSGRMLDRGISREEIDAAFNAPQTVQAAYEAGLNEQQIDKSVLSSAAQQAYNDGLQNALVARERNVSVQQDRMKQLANGYMTDISRRAFIERYIPGMNADIYKKSFDMAYDAGRQVDTYTISGADAKQAIEKSWDDFAKKNSIIFSQLSVDQAKGIFSEGMTTAMRDRQAAIARSNMEKLTAVKGNGTFTDFRANPTNDASTRVIAGAARMFGLNIELRDTIEGGSNGYYDAKRGTIVLNASSGKTLVTLAHELGEFTDAFNTEEFQPLVQSGMQTLNEILGEKEYQKMRRAYEDVYVAEFQNETRPKTDADLDKEIFCDNIFTIIGSEEGMNNLISKIDQNCTVPQAKTIKEKLSEMIGKVIDAFKSIINSGKLNNWQQAAAEDSAKRMQDLQDRLTSAMANAVKNYETASLQEIESDLPVQKRFNLETGVEQTKDLIAVHNLTSDQLMGDIALGGLPSPSIAIIRAGMGHEKYGDISLVFGKDTIDPKKSAKNKVYGGDAWTPTFPSVEYKLNDEKIYQIAHKIEELVPQGDARLLGGISIDYVNTPDRINSADGDPVAAYANSDVMKYAYLVDKGENIKPKTREKRLTSKFENNEIVAVADMFSEKELSDIRYNMREFLSDNQEKVEEIRKTINDEHRKKYEKFNQEDNPKLRRLYEKDFIDEMYFSLLDDIINAAEWYKEHGIGQESDPTSLREIINQKTDEDSFHKWLDDLFNGVIEKKGIRNGKSVFTNSGNRRNWDQLHDDYTLENIVKAMSAEDDKGSNAFFAQSAIQALATKDFKSIADIRKSEGQLRTVSQEEYSALQDEHRNRFNEIAERLINPNSRRFMEIDEVASNIADAISRYKTADSIEKYLKKYYGNRAYDGIGRDIVDLRDSIAEMPTEYFEAKPKRAVWLDEVQYAIIPDNSPAELTKALSDNNITYRTYTAGDEASRLDVMDSLEDVRFSREVNSEGKQLTEDQQEYFKDSKVRTPGGSLKVMYHGTPTGGFTVFKNGLQFFTENKEYADRYQNPSASSRQSGKEAINPQTYAVYLNITKPFDIRDPKMRRTFIDDYVKGGWALGINPYTEYKDSTVSGLPSWEEADNIYEWMEENDLLDKYDGILVDEGGVPDENGEVISRGIAYITFSPEQIKNIDNLTPTSDPDIRYSLEPVDPIEPTSDKWHPGTTFAEAKAMYPRLFDTSGDTETTRNPTQVPITSKTYRKVYEYLKKNGFSGSILDASSGLGEGTRMGRAEYGYDVDDIEPYPSDEYEKTLRYKDYSSFFNSYDFIINNAVLNVMCQDNRDELVKKMGEMLNPGGTIFINVRSIPDVESAKGKQPINTENHEWYLSNRSYQKGFTFPELIAYLQDGLGDDFTIEKAFYTDEDGKKKAFPGVSVFVHKSEDAEMDPRYTPRSENTRFSRDVDTRETLKTLKGSSIKRSKYGVGKDIGGQLYFHKNYVNDLIQQGVIPREVYDQAIELLPDDFEYNTLMYDYKSHPDRIRFDSAPNFDTAREPYPGNYMTVDTSTGEVKPGKNFQIWHHKWQWVKDDYKGFDVDESYNWSKEWLQSITSPSGQLQKWNQALLEAGLPLDERENYAPDVRYSREIDDLRKSMDAPEVDFTEMINSKNDDAADSGIGNVLAEGSRILKGQQVDQQMVRKIARKLTRKYGSKADINQFADDISRVFAYAQSHDIASADSEELARIMTEVAMPVIEQAKSQTNDEIRKEVRAKLSGVKLDLSQIQHDEVVHAFDNYQNYKRQMKKYGVEISMNGSPMDSSWLELASKLSGLLPESVNEGDQPIVLLETLSNLEKKQVSNGFGMNDPEAAKDLAMDVIAAYYEEMGKKQTSKTYDKDIAELKKQVAEAKKIGADYKAQIKKEYEERYDEALKDLLQARQLADKNVELQLKAIKEQGKYDTQGKLDKLKAEYDIQDAERLIDIAVLRAQNRHDIQRRLDAQEKAKQKSEIQKGSRQLLNMLANPTNAKHVPISLEAPVLDLLSSIDFVGPKIDKLSDGRYQTKVLVTTEEQGQLRRRFETYVGDTYQDVMRQYQEAMQSGAGSKAQRKWQQKLSTVKDLYTRAGTEGDSNSATDLLEMLDKSLLPDLQKILDDNDGLKTISSLSADELKTINKAIKNITTAINKIDKFYTSPESVSKLGNDIMEHAKKVMDTNVRSRAKETLKDFFTLDNATPETYFHGLGKSGEKVFKMLTRANNVKARDIRIAQEYMADLLKDVSQKDIDSMTGEKAKIIYEEGSMKLDVGDVMYLYMLLKRQDAESHKYGGFEMDDKEIKGKVYRDTKPHFLDEKKLRDITDKLTPKQKEIAEKMQQFLAVNCSEWGNETAILLYGYEKFTDPNYIPMTVDKKTVRTNAQNSAEGMINSIRESGFTKNVVPNANNPLIIRNIFDVFSEHVTNMAAYHAYAAPLTDVIRWNNFKTTEEIEEGDAKFGRQHTVKEAIDDIYGKGGQSYLVQLVRDINQMEKQTKVGTARFGGALTSRYKAAATLANLRVVAQQPTAWFRAGEMIDAKYLAAGLAPNKAADKMQAETSDISWVKSQGNIDGYITHSMKQTITRASSTREKINDAAGWLASKADDVTWNKLYRAVYAEQAAKYDGDLNSEEFARKVNDRFDEVIARTQVVDGTLMRSQLMRSSDRKNVSVSAFMAEPTKSYNMFLRDYIDITQGKREGKKIRPADLKHLSRTAAVYLVTNVANAVMQSIFDAERDDDEDKSYIEKLLNAFGISTDSEASFKDKSLTFLEGNFMDDLNMLNNIPIINDMYEMVWSAVKKTVWGENTYTSSTSDFDVAGLNELVKAWNYTFNKGEKSKITLYGTIAQDVKALSQVSGIPVYNLMRECVALYNTLNDAWGGENIRRTAPTSAQLVKPVFDSIDTGSDYKEAIEKAVQKGSKYETIETNITKQYKQQYIDLMREGKTEEAAKLENRLMMIYDYLNEKEGQKPSNKNRVKKFYTDWQKENGVEQIELTGGSETSGSRMIDMTNVESIDVPISDEPANIWGPAFTTRKPRGTSSWTSNTSDWEKTHHINAARMIQESFQHGYDAVHYQGGDFARNAQWHLEQINKPHYARKKTYGSGGGNAVAWKSPN